VQSNTKIQEKNIIVNIIHGSVEAILSLMKLPQQSETGDG
jgi:hypothetical protein